MTPSFYALSLFTIFMAAVVGTVWANSPRGEFPKTLLVLAVVFWLSAGIAFLLGK